jgi:cytidyltransferase-like protein
MIYCFDVDGTICDTNKNDYKNSIPRQHMVEKINKLYEDHRIKIFTARGCVSGIDWEDYTARQLDGWGIKYHELICNKKPHFDLLVDDKAIHVDRWVDEYFPKKVGLIAGCFDILHPGYIKMFEDARTVCDWLIVALHENPNQEREKKYEPLFSVQDRKKTLESINYVSKVVTYRTEEDLETIIKEISPDVRIIGSDYRGKLITGQEYSDEIYFHEREHDHSYSKVRRELNV